jgi:hypothetical protein
LTGICSVRDARSLALTFGLLLVLIAAVGAAPALATFPPTSVPCDAEHVGAAMRTSDGERWRCEFDEELQDYFWVPLAPTELPTDAVVWNKGTWTAPDGVNVHVRPRLEWINSTLYSGADVYLRKPLTARYSVAAGNVQILSRVFVWNASTKTWSICRDTGWVTSTAAGHAHTPTFTWGTAPCGSTWYAATGHAAYFDGTAWRVTPAFKTDAPGSVNLGDPTYVKNGYLWDAEPGVEPTPAPKVKPYKKAPAPPETPPVG